MLKILMVLPIIALVVMLLVADVCWGTNIPMSLKFFAMVICASAIIERLDQ